MTENPYAVPIAGRPPHAERTVAIYPHEDGCEAVVVVVNDTFIINETQDIYSALWGLIDRITGQFTCQRIVSGGALIEGPHRYCDKPVFDMENECVEHRGAA